MFQKGEQTGNSDQSVLDFIGNSDQSVLEFIGNSDQDIYGEWTGTVKSN